MPGHEHGEGDFCRLYFDRLPVSLWHFDMSAIREDYERIVSALVEAPGMQPAAGDVRGMLAKVKLLEVNATTLALYEAPDLQSLQGNFSSIIPEETFNALLEGTKELFGPQGSFSIETWNRTLGGKRIEVRMHLFSEGSDDGSERYHVLMAVDDLTSIRAQDERLRLLSTLPEANPDMVIIMDCESRLLYINPKARAWLADRNPASDDGIFALLPQDYRQHECGTCDRESERQSTFEFEDRHYRLKIHPFPGQNRCMITIADVTDLAHLTEDRKLFSEAMQSSMRPIMITDRTGKILHANKAFEQLYGYAIDEIRGKNPHILNPGREVYYDLGYSEQAYDELFAGMWRSALDPDTARWEGELVNKAKDGRLVWAHLTMSGIKCEQGLISHFIAMPVDVTEQRKNEQVVRLELYRTIASVAEMRDNETGHHMLRVGAYARILANAIGMSARFTSDIETFAPLHDIGKVGITDEVLLARRKLTDTEYTVMRNHAVLGHQILAGKPGLEMADEICWCHHERWDGTGYPRGLNGVGIPLSARLTSIADVYDALRNKRPYKPAWTHTATLAEMVSASGTQFDPDLIDALVNNEAAFEAVYSSPQYEDKPAEGGNVPGGIPVTPRSLP